MVATRSEPVDEHALVDEGLSRLRSILGEQWSVEPLRYGDAKPMSRPDFGADLVISVSAPHRGSTSGPILIEGKWSLTPAGVRTLLPRLALMQSLTGDATALVISRWLSSQTRALLDENGIGYLDLTGNVSFRLDRPGVVIRLQGSDRAPSPELRPSRSLRGEKAGALVRALVDHAPPFRATQLAEMTGLSLPYVSRLLETMTQEALIERHGRTIRHVDWPRLLRARASVVQLVSAGPVLAVAPQGPAALLNRLLRRGHIQGEPRSPLLAVTGPALAERVSPLTGDISPLILYLGGRGVPSASHLGIDDFMAENAVIPVTGSGATTNVWIFKDPPSYVFKGLRTDYGFPAVALSQCALDCLSGPGRMQSQGEAVLDAMIRTETQWRRPAAELP